MASLDEELKEGLLRKTALAASEAADAPVPMPSPLDALAARAGMRDYGHASISADSALSSPEERARYNAIDPFAVSDKPGGLKPEVVAALHDKFNKFPVKQDVSFPGSRNDDPDAAAKELEAQAAMDRTTGAPGLAGSGGLPPAQPNAVPPGQYGTDKERKLAQIAAGIASPTPEQGDLDRMRQDGAIAQQAAAQQQADFNAAERERVAQIEQANLVAQERALAELRAAQAQALENSRKRLETMEKDAVEDPNRFWDNHFAGPVFGRIGAAIGIGLATFGGQGQLAYKMVSDGINRDIDAQRQTLAAKQKLAERWGQHDARSAALLEDRMEDLERARVTALNDSARRMENMAKGLGDQNKIRAAGETAAKLRADAANHGEQIKAAVSKRVFEDRKKKEAEAKAAAANSVYARTLKADLEGRLAGIKERSKNQITGEGGPGEIKPELMEKMRARYSKGMESLSQMRNNIDEVKAALRGADSIDTLQSGMLPRMLQSDTSSLLGMSYENLSADEMRRRTGAAATIAEVTSLKKALQGRGTKQDWEVGLQLLERAHDTQLKRLRGGFSPGALNTIDKERAAAGSGPSE